MGNRLSSSAIFPRTYVVGDPPDNPERFARSKHWTWRFWRSTYLHVDVQWHWMDEERKFWIMCFKCGTIQEVRENILARTLNILRPWRRKEGVWNSQWHTWRKMGFLCETNAGTILKETDHPVFKSISALSCGILKRKKRDTIHIRADASNTKLLFRTIHTAQKQRSSCLLVWRVRSNAEWDRTDFGKVRGKRKCAVTEECETARSKFFGAKLQGVMIQHLETECEIVFRNFKHWRKVSNLQKFAKMRHSGKESLLECATRPLQT